MGLFSKDKKQEKVEEPEEEESEDDNCSMNIYTSEESGNIQLDRLTKEQLRNLRKYVEKSVQEKSLLNLEDYGYNQVINGNYIVSFDWQEE